MARSPFLQICLSALILSVAIASAPVSAEEAGVPQRPLPAQMHGPNGPRDMMTRGSMMSASVAQGVERRIADIHGKLRITPAQETKWNDVAQVMRKDAQAIEAIANHRQLDLANMTAVENLRSFQKLAQAHADGLNNLSAAFEPLYADMSDEQKKNADAVFRYQQDMPRPPIAKRPAP